MFNCLNKRLKTAFLTLSFSILGGLNLFADQISVSSFKYLNSNENSTILDPSESQDLLNVDVTPGGKSVKKRPGYGTYKSLLTFQPTHGGYHFFDASGNDVQLWGSSTTLKAIVADAAPTVLVTSATAASTFDCTDSQGSAYCENSNRDGLFKTNGATLQLWTNAVLGTMVEMTPDRLAIAGVSATPNTIYHSQANTFTNFTVGPLNSDAFTEVIASPGSKITHIRWACGKLLWWKDQSFGYEDFDDQYSLSIKIVSDTIGTFDNTSAMDPGGNVWFRGQDGHIWRYDCSALTKESIEITPQIQTSGRRTSNLYTQSSQADWQTGSSSGTNSISTTISPGDVVIASFTVTENSSASGWGSGTVNSVTVFTSSYSVTPGSAPVLDPSYEAGGSGSFGSEWTVASDDPGSRWNRATTYAHNNCSVTADNKSAWARTTGMGTTNVVVKLIKASDNSVLNSFKVGSGVCQTASCAWTSAYLSSVPDLGTSVKLRFVMPETPTSSTMTTTNAFTLRGDVGFRYVCVGDAGSNVVHVDNIQNSTTTASFTSQGFNTGMPWSFALASATWTAGDVTPAFVLQKSANGTTWNEVSASSGVNVSVNAGYVRYISTITAYAYGNASNVTGVNILARSSGTYFSPVKAAPNLSAWSTFNPNWTDNGDDIQFYIRGSTSPFYVQNSSPPWVLQTPGALVVGSTGSFVQFSASFTVTAATNTPSVLQDQTINWFDGSATDQAYMMYFDNAIWASVAYGTGVSSNTYVFRRDLINDGWGLYNFGVGGMLVQGNRLYFGDVSTGTIFLYGSGTSDNGSAINAFWKSKDFTGADPFIENSLTNIDTYAKQNAGQSLTATYTLNTSTSTSYTIALTSTTQTIIQNRKLLPAGKNGYNFNYKFGDNTTASAWEVFGFRVGYNTQSYRPSQ